MIEQLLRKSLCLQLLLLRHVVLLVEEELCGVGGYLLVHAGVLFKLIEKPPY